MDSCCPKICCNYLIVSYCCCYWNGDEQLFGGHNKKSHLYNFALCSCHRFHQRSSTFIDYIHSFDRWLQICNIFRIEIGNEMRFESFLTNFLYLQCLIYEMPKNGRSFSEVISRKSVLKFLNMFVFLF